MIDPFGRAKLLLSPSSGRLARRLALPVGMSHQRPRKVYQYAPPLLIAILKVYGHLSDLLCRR